MFRRLLCACFGAAFIGGLGLSPCVLAKPPDLPLKETITVSANEWPSPQPVLYQLRPTARCTMAGSLLFVVHPMCSLLPTERFLDALCDHPSSKAEQSEGYIYVISPGEDTKASDKPSTASPELLPMPREEHAQTDGVTCPYLRQQMMDRHASLLADPEVGRDVLDNLQRLRQAETLLELSRELAQTGYSVAAMECSLHAQQLCPGSPCAQRAGEILLEIACGIASPATDSEEASEQDADDDRNEPGVEQMVDGLMKSCYLLVEQGMTGRAAELARQAFAVAPQRVMADPLMYKMHLLSEMPVAQPSGTSEISETPTCPYCGSAGTPIRAILPEKKKSKEGPTTLRTPVLPPVDYKVVQELERVLTESPVGIGAHADGNLHVEGDYAVGSAVYHLRYDHGSLAIWKTTDASK